MKKIFATTAFALTFAAGAASAQTLTGADEVTCSEFLAMEVIEQEAMLSEIIALSDGGSLAETTLADVEIVCVGNDDIALTEVLDS
ncbi:hypothetical protein [Yoonia sp.]|uniref:hypothetical protein n=1 Tax=Yoonia sp. TaxID=2212373 RepID=UPI003A4DEBF2|nr:hypothetical protein [Loktanella sp.]